jgi:glyoxylase-like metal-dependent hydrolase (beta-lactamase superfamily II)
MKTYTIGAVSVQRVHEQPFRNVPFAFLYPNSADSELEIVARQLSLDDMEDNRVELIQSIHTWVVRTPEHIILVDTGSGNDKQRPLNPIFHEQSIPFLNRLKHEAGIAPEDVDYVINTHLHVDHSGWNTILKDGRWVPTFPNARYVFPRLEAEYYASPASHNDANIPSRGVFEDSILPIIKAGLVDFIEPEGGRYLDLFTFIPTSGHSIGHMSVELVSKGETAIFGGDIMHTPVQVFQPHLNTVFCEFQDQALGSRERMLSKLADEGSLYFSTHFAGSSAGYVTRTNSGYAWTYA